MFHLEMLSSQGLSNFQWWTDSKEKPLGLVHCISGDILSHCFYSMSELRFYICIQVIADFLSNEEVEDIKDMFKKMDNDNDGIVSIEELKAGFRNFGSQLAESEVQLLIEAVSMVNFPLFL